MWINALDDVVNVQHRCRKHVFPAPELEPSVANGDIGVVVGQYEERTSEIEGNPWKLEVEFPPPPRGTSARSRVSLVSSGATLHDQVP